MRIEKNVEYHTVSSHDVYKLFTYTDSTYSDDGLTINSSLAPQSDSTSAKETTQSYNYYFLNHNFYSIYNNSSFGSFKSKYTKQNNYVLQEAAKFLSIPIRSFGKRLHQGSLSIVGTATLQDDGFGNLIDTAIATSSIYPETDLQVWFSFDDGYKCKEFPYKSTITLRDNSVNLSEINIVNGTFTGGISGSGYQYNLHGNSFAYSDLHQVQDFNKSDFSVNFWLNCPSSQSVNTTELNTIISKRFSIEDKYPFEMQIYNTTSTSYGKILISRKGYKDRVALQPVSFTSSARLNDSAYHYVSFIKSGSLLNLYIDGVLDSSTNDYEGYYDTSNASNLFIGATGDGVNTVLPSSYFSGSIDEFRIYRSAISPTLLYNTPLNTNIVGSIFYEKGFVIINSPFSSYNSIFDGSFTLTYRSVSELNEHEIVVKAGIGEFNMTMNPSIRINGGTIPIPNISSSLASGSFTPFITGIGLYNDDNQLLAMAKLREPILSTKDIDLIFKIRFDL